MAPEYLVRGQLTEKADVYAFGVLVIEVASGRRNSVFSEGSSSVLHTVRFIFIVALNRALFHITSYASYSFFMETIMLC